MNHFTRKIPYCRALAPNGSRDGRANVFTRRSCERSHTTVARSDSRDLPIIHVFAYQQFCIFSLFSKIYNKDTYPHIFYMFLYENMSQTIFKQVFGLRSHDSKVPNHRVQEPAMLGHEKIVILFG